MIPSGSRTPGLWWPILERHRRSKQSESEQGFTLVELLVTLVVLPIIVGALAVALITVFSQQTSVAKRVAGSADAQVTSANFVTDVQAATSFTTDKSTSPAACGTGVLFVLGLDWTNAAGTTTVVSYWESTRGSVNTLFRLACQSGSLVSSTVLSHDAPANLGLGTGRSGLVVTCGPAANAPLCTTGAFSNQWITTAGILSVQLTTGEPTTKYTYILSATPRAWTPQSSGNPPGGNLPLLLLNSSGYTCSGSASPGVSVTGTVATDSTSDGAINLHSGSQLQASSIYTADTSTPPNVYSGATPTPPPPVTPGGVIPDPYAGIPAPTSTHVDSTDTTLTSSSQPGEYTQAISNSSPGTVTLPTGIYIFDQGLSLSGQASIQSGAGGVLLYIAGGAIKDTGQGGFTLSPIQIPPYTGLSLWQAKSDTTALSLVGNGAGSTIGGAIYAPGASVGGSGNGALSAGSIVSNGLSCAGNGQITIG